MSSKAILFLVGIFAVMAGVAAMAFAVTSGAEASHDHDHYEHQESENLSGGGCDTKLCVGMDKNNQNRIRVERMKDDEGNTVWGSEVWRIRVLRDTSVERYGAPCAPDYCNYDGSQKGKHRAMTYDYQCVDGESEIGVYVQYFKGDDLATLPHFNYPDGWSIFEVYDQTIKLPVSC